MKFGKNVCKKLLKHLRKFQNKIARGGRVKSNFHMETFILTHPT